MNRWANHQSILYLLAELVLEEDPEAQGSNEKRNSLCQVQETFF